MNRFSRQLLLIFLVALFGQATLTRAQDSPLQKGDHVVYIGNTLADRMQHHGWLETYAHALLPEHELTFRNIGFSGDEVKLRQRADNFGNADQWLTKCEADVVAGFFGYNEAFKGEAGLESFAGDLSAMIDQMRSMKYNGESAPRLVIFSPIAHENVGSRHLPDGTANNKNLALYTAKMKEVCQMKSVPFVDLFALSTGLYAKSDKPLTMNGIHLLDHGNRALAQAIIKSLEPDAELPSDESIAKLRAAVLDKNYHWFSRYRVVDEYNVFGGRSKLAWFGQSNADVMMREMEIFDVKTVNRDKHIWALAQGKDVTVNDDNLPQELVVKPNRDGPLEGGAFAYVDGEAALDKMTIHEGFEANLFASEKEFPRLVNPVQIAVDTDSRLWASVWESYPHWNPAEPRKDALVILPDENGDGKADDLIVFADELNSVTGFEFWGGGVLVAAPPELWFLKDTDGDDKADLKIRVLQGVSSADTHHSANAMVIGPDGWLYWSRGIFNVAAFETPTKTYRSGASGVHRFNPRTYEIEFHYPIGPNPHGDVFDRWGYQFANDGTSGTGGYISVGKGQRPGGRQWFKKEWRPVAATGILSSSHFPAANQENFLICNCIGFLGVLQYEVAYNGAEITANRTTDLIRSTDDNFRPTDIEIGGDGAIYIADWHNALIGHMQHNMRDPNRDHKHGRIYRVTASGRDVLKPVKMKGKPIAEVLTNLFATENSVRYRARLELSGRDSSDVEAAVTKFTFGLNPTKDDPNRNEALALLECLWVHEEHRIPSMALVKRTFEAKDARVRAAAIRSLGHWAGKVDDWETILGVAARDESGLVRSEAAKAAVEFQGIAAAEVIFEVATRDIDPELNSVLNYARQSINVDSMIASAIESGKDLSPAAMNYALLSADANLLLKMKRTPEVYQTLITRSNISVAHRWEAIEALAKRAKRTPVQELLVSLLAAERESHDSLGDLATMLATLDAGKLSDAASQLKMVAVETKSGDIRKAVYSAWIRSGGAKDAFKHALGSRESLADVFVALQRNGDQQTRSELYPVIRPLMFELPERLRSDEDDVVAGSGPPVAFEYYEPNPAQNVANETLNKAKPKFTGAIPEFSKYVPGGRADAFATRQTASIFIPTTGTYTFYVSSDDGSRIYIDGQLVVNNDGLHGNVERGSEIRLNAGLHQIVVTYFDNGGGDGLVVSWQGPGIKKQVIKGGSLRASGSSNLRAQALQVVAAWPGNLEDKISDFAQLVKDDSLSSYAMNALSKLPGQTVVDALTEANAQGVLDALLTEAGSATPVQRQSDDYSELLALGGNLMMKAKVNALVNSRKLTDLKGSIPVKADPQVMALGREVYSRESHCATCHQPHGQGLPNLYPPLDGSLWATGSEDRLIRMVLDGMHGTINVKGKRYSSPPLPPMTGFRHLLNDEEIAAVVTYARNSWSNRAKPVGAGKVATVRAIDRGANAAFWAANDLLAKYPLEDGREPIASTSDGWLPTFVKAWKAEDFTKTQLESGGRSFDEGLLAFNRLGCAQCHKLGDTGGVFGPNLAKLDAKKRNADYVLNSIVLPSKDIDPKYAMQTYVLVSGQIVSGLVVEETKTEVRIISDPLNLDKPTVIKKDDIDEQTKTSTSIMPQGLLNWLSHEEVLDLITYVLAAGDKTSELYKK
jgi:putative heme-binding domain-containing protein